MPPLEAFAPAVAIGLILLVMGWFAWGTQRNIQTGNRVLTWLQGALPRLGRRTTLRWLGSSAVELTIVDPATPFREATVMVVLEPRDVSLLWAFARSRGRRDFVIVRLNLTRPPRFSMDLRDPRGWTSRWDGGSAGRAGVGAGAVAEDGWQVVDGPADSVARATPGADEASVRGAWDRLVESTGGLWRLTVQPVVPHLEVHFLPPDPDRVPAELVLGPVQDLATTLSAR